MMKANNIQNRMKNLCMVCSMSVETACCCCCTKNYSFVSLLRLKSG
jgi:hypothetical protein